MLTAGQYAVNCGIYHRFLFVVVHFYEPIVWCHHLSQTSLWHMVENWEFQWNTIRNLCLLPWYLPQEQFLHPNENNWNSNILWSTMLLFQRPSRTRCTKWEMVLCYLDFQVLHMVVRVVRVWAPSPAPPPTALRISPRVCQDHRAWTLTLPPVKKGKSFS